ncbi:hypothetical protein HJFPF1_04841 [Paramyrothecium foliicola]|nr:hypothetical protein HJFPF1_04841 [Paramyrothecium foliicola]
MAHMPLTDEKLLIHIHLPLPAGWHDKVTARFPGLRVQWEQASVEGGAIANADTLPPDVWDGVTMLFVYPAPSYSNMAGVRFVQLPSAGSDHWESHEAFKDPNVLFCSASGSHAPQIAEWVIGTWIAHEHRFALYAEQQRASAWRARPELPVRDGQGRRIGILGYGAIGRQCARLAQALGMEVYAYTKSPRPTPESKRLQGYCVEGTGDVEGLIPAKWFSGDSINEFVGQDLDILVLCLPLSDATRKLIGREQFAIMSKSNKKTFLSNIARGPIVDTDALLEALNDGLICGAALDVTDPEPLPADHPLWKAPNVTITPHISWQSSALVERALDVLYQNLEKLDKGEPLLNAIKK